MCVYEVLHVPESMVQTKQGESLQNDVFFKNLNLKMNNLKTLHL